MKAEHRRELHTNVLADLLGRLLQGMKSSPKSTSVLAWLFVFLALGTFAVWQYSASATYTGRSALWLRFNDAIHDLEKGPAELVNLEHEQPGTIPSRSARFEMARLSFQQGQAGLTSSHRADAILKIEQARDLYKQLSKECADAPLLAQEALMGVAKAEESLIGIPDPQKPAETLGTLERALDAYRQLADRYPKSVLGEAAAQRVKDWDKKETREKVEAFYTELNQLAGPKTKPESKGP